MKAITYTAYGNPEVLQLKTIDTPLPKDGEVLIKVKAASVNSWDIDLLLGKPYLYRLLFGLFTPKYKILGCDVSGHIEAVGNDVTRFKSGDEVLGDISATWGGFAEYVCVPETALRHKPQTITHQEAAALPQAGVLALQSLQLRRPLKASDKVLINGAGGGLGTFALQLAKNVGAEVTCVDSGDKLGALSALGADFVIDYTRTDFCKAGKHYDLIIDVVAQRSVFAYRHSLAPQGTAVIVGGAIRTLLHVAFIGSIRNLFGKKKTQILIHEPNKDLDTLTEMMSRGQLKAVIDHIYPLSEVPRALQRLLDKRAVGKIVISM